LFVKICQIKKLKKQKYLYKKYIMRGYFAANTISEEERSNILSQHKTLYNGYQTLNPEIPNTQPLYVQDFAKDKVGAVMGNKGNIKGYTNMGINEQVEEQSFPYDKGIVSEGECSECGGAMMEGECSECGWKGNMEEGTGKLDDIYDEEDLDPNAEFDYVKGASNKTNAFHVKENMMKTPIGKISAIGGMKEQGGNADDMDVDDVEPAYDFVSNGPMDGGDVYPVNEDGDEEMNFDDLIDMDTDIESERDNLEQEGYEQMESAWAEDIDEVDISGSQGIYGDMDPAYDFDSEGPGKGGPYQEFHGETVSDNEGEMEEQWAQVARVALPMAASYIGSKLADNNEGEVDEQPISKLYYNKMKRKKSAVDKGEEFDDTELDISDYEGDFDRETSSWEDVSKITNDDEFGYVDEDIRESVIIQKNRIMEMMNRMKVIK
jgi:hypothetical protein